MDLDILKGFIDKELTHAKIGLINRFATDEMTLADMKCAFSPQAGACINMNCNDCWDCKGCRDCNSCNSCKRCNGCKNCFGRKDCTDRND